MEAGKLRHFVTLERPTVATDSHGDQVATWAAIGTAWASVEPLSGREFLSVGASQVVADVTVAVKMRGRPDLVLTPKDRVRYGSRIFEIRHVVDWQGRGVEWSLLCTERF